jgi:hypothetical protein
MAKTKRESQLLTRAGHHNGLAQFIDNSEAGIAYIDREIQRRTALREKMKTDYEQVAAKIEEGLQRLEKLHTVLA